MAEDKVVLHFEVRDDGTTRVFNQAGKELGQLERQAAQASGAVTKSLSAIGDGAAALGGALGIGLGAAATALAALGKQAIDRADDFNTLSERTGVTVETLTGLAGVAIENDVSLDTLARGMQRLSREMGKGNEVFGELGVKIRDAQGQYRDVADVFQDTVARLSLLPLAERNSKAAELFSRSYMEMSGVLRLHESELRAQMDRGRESIQVTTEQAQAADDLKEQLSYLKDSVVSLGGSIIDPLVPSLARGTQALSEFAATAARALRDIWSMGPIDAAIDWVKRGLEGGVEWRRQEARKFGAYGMTSETGAQVMTDVSSVSAASIYNAEYSTLPGGAIHGPPTSAMNRPKATHGGGGRGGGGGGGYSADRDAARELARLAKEEEESIRRSTQAYQDAREIRKQTATEAARAAMQSARTDEEKIRAFAEQQRIERESLQVELHRLDLQLRFADASELTAGEQEKLRAQIEAARANLDAMPGAAKRFSDELENARRTVFSIGDELESGVRRVVDGMFAGGGKFKLNDILKGTGQAMASGFVSALVAAELKKNEFDVMVNENMTVKMPGIFKAGSVMIEDTWGGLMSSLSSATTGTTAGIGQAFSSLFGSTASGASSLGSVFSGALSGIGRLFGRGGGSTSAGVVGMTGADGSTVAVPEAGSGAAPAAASGGIGAGAVAAALIAGNALLSGFRSASSTANRDRTTDDIMDGRYTTDSDVYKAFSRGVVGSIPVVGGLLNKLGVGTSDLGALAFGGPIGLGVQKLTKKIFGVDIVGEIFKGLGIVQAPTRSDQLMDWLQDQMKSAGIDVDVNRISKHYWYKDPRTQGGLGLDADIMRGNPALESYRLQGSDKTLREDLQDMLYVAFGSQYGGFESANVLLNNARQMNKTTADTLSDVDKLINQMGLSWENVLEQWNTHGAQGIEHLRSVANVLGKDLPIGVNAFEIALSNLDEATGRMSINIKDFKEDLESAVQVFGKLSSGLSDAMQQFVERMMTGQPGSINELIGSSIETAITESATNRLKDSYEWKNLQSDAAGFAAASANGDRVRMAYYHEQMKNDSYYLENLARELRSGMQLAHKMLQSGGAPGTSGADETPASTFDRAAAGSSFREMAAGLRGSATELRVGAMSKARQRAYLYSQLDVVSSRIAALEVGGITSDEVSPLQTLLGQRGDIGRGIAGLGGRRNTMAGAGILESTADIAERWARILDPQVSATQDNTVATKENTDSLRNLIKHVNTLLMDRQSGRNHPAAANLSSPINRATIRRIVMQR